MATQIRSMTPDLLKKELDEIVYPIAGKTKGRNSFYRDHEASNLFGKVTVDGQYYVAEIMKDMGLFGETLEDEAYGESNFGMSNKITFSPYKYTKSLKISEEMLADNQYDKVLNKAKSMGEKAYKTRFVNSAEVYRGAFTVTTTAHGKFLVDDTNTTLNGDAADNKITTSFSETALDTAVDMVLKQLDHDGTIADLDATDLLIPIALRKQAKVLFDSVLKPGTGNNDVNVYSRVVDGFDLELNVLKTIGSQVAAVAAAGGKQAVTAGSDTAWFVLDRGNHTIKRFIREDLKTWMTDPSTNREHNTFYNAKLREAVGAIDYIGIVGSDGTV